MLAGAISLGGSQPYHAPLGSFEGMGKVVRRVRRPHLFMAMRQLLLATTLLLTTALPATAQIITGRVIDDATGQPVRAAEVRLLDRVGSPRQPVISDSLGRFRITAAPGEYHLRANSLGYTQMETREFTLKERTELQLELRLNVAALPLVPVRVLGERPYRPSKFDEFNRRAAAVRTSGFGHILGREEIERTKPVNMGNLVRSLGISGYLFGDRTVSPADCPLMFFLDDVETSLDIINSSVDPDDVEGVEYYRLRTQVPPELINRVECGAVLVWTNPRASGSLSWKKIAVGAALASLVLVVGLNSSK